MESHLKERKNSGGGILHFKANSSTGENINESPPKVKTRMKVPALPEIVFYHKTSKGHLLHREIQNQKSGPAERVCAQTSSRKKLGLFQFSLLHPKNGLGALRVQSRKGRNGKGDPGLGIRIALGQRERVT